MGGMRAGTDAWGTKSGAAKKWELYHIKKGLVSQRLHLFIFAELNDGFEEGQSKPGSVHKYFSVKSVRLGPFIDIFNIFGSTESNP
jgi:hypothetical protein